MSKKLDAVFSADISKELFDFTGNSNYLLCYDSSLDYYAIMNMNSGSIMERSNGLVYDGHFYYKCYYACYISYFYEKDNMIYSVNEQVAIDIEDAYAIFNEYSRSLMDASVEESQFKSREDIKLYVDKELRQEGIKITKCSESNRGKVVYANNVLYNMLVLCNSMYTGAVEKHDFCYVEAGGKIGFVEFDKYDGGKFSDTLFPINIHDTCGVVAATMLLQYYERNRILNTISPDLYAKASSSITNGNHHFRSNILSEILHDSIAAHHPNGGANSTYVTVKNAINAYFAEKSISGISATSSASWWGLKSAIDDGDPCIVFVGLCNLFYLNNNLETYTAEYLWEGHAMYTYGYTLTGLNVVDEYICHAGWNKSDNFYSTTYVAKTAIAGNVRLLY
ncbi:MAG: C39 family peptidase [Clostridia bacterium]|nr:C39 family peptidase [Clostridia bacterium]